MEALSLKISQTTHLLELFYQLRHYGYLNVHCLKKLSNMLSRGLK